MKVLVLMVAVSAAMALPKKPTKTFPKKFDASLDGKKSSYSVLSHQPDEDVVESAGNAFLRELMPPSSYATYFEQPQQDHLLPPEESSYSTVPKVSQGVPLAPPPVDSYSSYSRQTGAGSVPMTPPSVSSSSYSRQTGAGSVPMTPPSVSSSSYSRQIGAGSVPMTAPSVSSSSYSRQIGAGSVAMTPPSVSSSSYSKQIGAGSVPMTPPSVSTDDLDQQESSYVSSDGVAEEALKAPPVSSDVSSKYMTSTEVLASLVAMAHMPPPTSSYSEDPPVDTRHYVEDEGPSRVLEPPRV